MSNVIQLFQPVIKKENSVKSFIGELYEWAEKEGINTSSPSFKTSAAGIMALLQGMIIDK